MYCGQSFTECYRKTDSGCLSEETEKGEYRRNKIVFAKAKEVTHYEI